MKALLFLVSVAICLGCCCPVPVSRQVTSTPQPTVSRGSVKLVNFSVRPWQIPNGNKAQMILVNWKNDSDTPVNYVAADIIVEDEFGNEIKMLSAHDQAVYWGSRAIAPGQTYYEPMGDGFVVLSIPGTNPAKVSVRITDFGMKDDPLK